MYDWTCETFMSCTVMDVMASIENPRSSYFWLTSFYKKLLEALIYTVCTYMHVWPKWTRIAANFKSIESLSLSCDGRHTRAKWGKTFGNEMGASLEAQYPRRLHSICSCGAATTTLTGAHVGSRIFTSCNFMTAPQKPNFMFGSCKAMPW